MTAPDAGKQQAAVTDLAKRLHDVNEHGAPMGESSLRYWENVAAEVARIRHEQHEVTKAAALAALRYHGVLRAADLYEAIETITLAETEPK